MAPFNMAKKVATSTYRLLIFCSSLAKCHWTILTLGYWHVSATSIQIAVRISTFLAWNSIYVLVGLSRIRRFIAVPVQIINTDLLNYVIIHLMTGRLPGLVTYYIPCIYIYIYMNALFCGICRHAPTHVHAATHIYEVILHLVMFKHCFTTFKKVLIAVN